MVEYAFAQHKGKAVIKIKFDYNKELVARVKKLPHVQWSQSMKCWYVPDTENYRLRFKLEPRVATPSFK